jgi:hypothetical protein
MSWPRPKVTATASAPRTSWRSPECSKGSPCEFADGHPAGEQRDGGEHEGQDQGARPDQRQGVWGLLGDQGELVAGVAQPRGGPGRCPKVVCQIRRSSQGRRHAVHPGHAGPVSFLPATRGRRSPLVGGVFVRPGPRDEC